MEKPSEIAEAGKRTLFHIDAHHRFMLASLVAGA